MAKNQETYEVNIGGFNGIRYTEVIAGVTNNRPTTKLGRTIQHRTSEMVADTVCARKCLLGLQLRLQVE